MRTRFANRSNGFICKNCGDSLCVTMADEIIISRKMRTAKRKIFCSDECAKQFKKRKASNEHNK